MGALRTIILSEASRKALQSGYEKGKVHEYRRRCRMILLKATGRSSREVATEVGCCEVVVNTWLSRYEQEGIQGLETKPGRGRKPILDRELDRAAIERVVKEHRQRLELARCELEQELGKSFCKKTLVRFLKVAAAAGTSEYVEGQ